MVKVTDHGFAKSDDPIYKEGYSVYIPPQSGASSSKPSERTPPKRTQKAVKPKASNQSGKRK